LGVSALMAPILVPRGVLWRDGGVGALAVLALIVAGHTLGLNRVTGMALLAALVAYLVFAYRQERVGQGHTAAFDRATAMAEADPAVTPDEQGPADKLPVALLLTRAGLVCIVGGGNLLVTSAIEIAANLGVADEVIGLTVVAVGTSLPELVTSVIAAIRKQGEIALGN